MGKLLLYAVFHANLDFSYIPRDLYRQVLHRCYWPVLRLVEEQEIPLGLEFSAHTLKTIHDLDSTFIKRLRKLWRDGACEVIGSGYVQAIMPLIPVRVNRENLRWGNTVYKELLGERPLVAFLNEQVYSAGLPRLYREAGYEALIVNWESAAVHGRLAPELRYQPCSVVAGEGEQMALLWHSVVAYRNFQNYAEQKIPLEAFLTELLSHRPDAGERAFPLYGSDWEVFDFKPWVAHPEGFSEPASGEMARIAHLFDLLKAREDVELVTPGSLLGRFVRRPMVQPESGAYPLPFKKQQYFPVTRWAVGGRDNVRLNSQCYRLYQALREVEGYLHQVPAGDVRPEADTLWRDLCVLWGSDLRSFTTEEKSLEFQHRMGDALARVERLRNTCVQIGGTSARIWLAYDGSEPSVNGWNVWRVSAGGDGSEAGSQYEFEIEGASVPCRITGQTVPDAERDRVVVRTVPLCSSQQAGIGVIKERPAPNRRRVEDCRIDVGQNSVTTPSVCLRLLPRHGGSIESLTFREVSSEPLIGRIHNLAYESLSMVDDLFSGDLALHDHLGRKTSDLCPTEIRFPSPGERSEVVVPVRFSIQTELGTIWKTYLVYMDQPRVDLVYRMQWRDTVPTSFRVGRMVLNPNGFDRETLYYATTNGGQDVERFRLQGQHVLHDESLGTAATARGCLGATEGWVVIGDAQKGLGFVTRPGKLYSVPLLHYEELDGGVNAFLLTLAHSLGELDETSHTLWRGHSTWSISILGGTGDLVNRVRACAALANGGLIVSPSEEHPA